MVILHMHCICVLLHHAMTFISVNNTRFILAGSGCFPDFRNEFSVLLDMLDHSRRIPIFSVRGYFSEIPTPHSHSYSERMLDRF
jgi:hypothetical protein